MPPTESHTSVGRLTPAEIEVLSQLSNQLSVSAIAAGRSRSVATISKQKQSAMRKLGITSSHQLHVYLSQVRNDTDDA
ncbi:hypothetical protein C1931_11990 [Stenotrophomonas sp. YAU14A_MKIMI4_1]|nr:hypothetical protein C1931_11990 [Stenotrophomonas sp. YAU14A_MKIMI4_1]